MCVDDRTIARDRCMPLLTPDDHAFFNTNAYVRVPQFVSPVNCDAVVRAIFEFLGFDPSDPSGWYRPPLKPRQTVIEMYQHQSMWDNRQHPRMYQAFAELLGHEKLI